MQRVLRAVPILLGVFLSPLPVRAWPPDGVALCTAVNTQNSPVIASDGAGGAIVAWIDYRLGTADIYTQRVDAMGAPLWAPDGQAICTAQNAQTNPRIVADDAGGAIIVWDDFRNGNHHDIYAQRVGATGVVQWAPDGVGVCTERFDQLVPEITSDGAGGAVVAWLDARFDDDIYAQRVDALGAALWTLSGVLVCDNSSCCPTVVPDGGGGAIVTWEDYRTPDANVYAQRLDASGATQWTANGLPVTTAADDQIGLLSISDGVDGAIATWRDFRNGPVDIYAQRIDGSGAQLWTLDGVVVAGFPATELEPTMASDAASGAIIAWLDNRVAGGDIYAQRVDASGSPMWTTDGIAVCGNMSDQANPHATSDGAGGAVISWGDQRYASDIADIFAQRIEGGGTALWATDGVPICLAHGTQAAPVSVGDGSGGAIIGWQDARWGPGGDIYAQRVGSGGGIPSGIGGAPRGPLAVRYNIPNPFAGATAIEIELGSASVVSIEVYDVAGRRLREMELGNLAAGVRRIPFDGRDQRGQPLPSGVYFYRVTADGIASVRKMVITR